MVWDTFLKPWANINSNWIKDLNGRTETIKHLEENMAICTLTLTLANFFWYVSSVKGNKQKSINGTTSNYKTFLQQRKLSIKQKNPHSKWKKIFANDIYKRLIFKMYKRFIHSTSKRQTTQVKRTEDMNRHLSQEDIQIAKRYMKKCSTKLNLRKMQIIPQWDITLHLSKWLLSKRLQVTNIAKDVEKGEPTSTIYGNVNWCSYYGKQYGGSSKTKTKQNYHMIQ